MKDGFRNNNSYQELILNLYWKEDAKEMNRIESKILKLNERLERAQKIHFHKCIYNEKTQPFNPIPETFNSVIIDLEGTRHLKLFGLFIRETIFFYGLKDGNVKEFYVFIAKLLNILKNVLLFGFTFWDLEVIYDIKKQLIQNYGCSVESLRFIDKLFYFNIQEYDKESISAALYSLGEEVPKDPLFRKSSNIDKLYNDGFYDIIVKHNFSCLKAEVIIFLRRFLKRHLIKFPQNIFELDQRGGL
jgi:hypothetical protein